MSESASVQAAGHPASAVPQPCLLFYCQHSLGIGHLTRSFALARALAGRFKVIFLNGGPLPAGVAPPPGIRIVHLPPLGMDDGHTLVSRAAGVAVDTALARRRALLLDVLATWRPAVVVVELFPFGRKKFAGEILPLLRAARAQPGGAARIVCSLRDILVSARRDQQRHDDRARWLANRYFDAVLVHADAGFARLDASFRPTRPLTVPVHYTGFVVPERGYDDDIVRQRRVVVSAGGGSVGMPLYSAALAAHALLWPQHRLPMRIIAGPFLPEGDWRALQQAAAGHDGLELVRHVPDLAAEMRRASASVSQCGYNSALDIVVAGVPALVVPYAAAGENEQSTRARLLAELGVLRQCRADEINGERLASEIVALMSFQPRAAALALDGAAASTAVLAQLVAAVPGAVQ